MRPRDGASFASLLIGLYHPPAGSGHLVSPHTGGCTKHRSVLSDSSSLCLLTNHAVIHFGGIRLEN